MQQNFTHQLDLFDSSPLVTELAPERGKLVTENQCAKLFLEFCLGKRGSYPSYVHALFSEILPRYTKSSEGADILTHHLLGFPADEAHAFDQKPHSTLGALWEKLVTIIYDLAFPGRLSKDWTRLLAKLDGDLKPRSGDKVTAEFHIDQIALEIKYRSGSYENTRKQALCARYIRGMGLEPLMLCLRTSPNTHEFRRVGWTVLEGEKALERIRSDTGVDPEAVLRIVGLNPQIRQIRRQGRARMYARLGDICSGHYERSHSHIAGSLHGRIAQRPEALLDVLQRAEAAGTLRDAVETIYAAHAAQKRKIHSPKNLEFLIDAGRDHFDPAPDQTRHQHRTKS
jgi:hypothetical protein